MMRGDINKETNYHMNTQFTNSTEYVLGALPDVIAHRGASHEAPENTLASFSLAWEQGADGIEGDFRLTADRRIVCLHDPDTSRTGDGDLAVVTANLAQLRKIDVGSWKGSAWAGERIPTLEEVLNIVPSHGRLYIEIKCGPEILPTLAAVLRNCGPMKCRVALMAFDCRVVAMAKQRLPGFPTYWLTSFARRSGDDRWSPSGEETAAVAVDIGADGVDFEAHSTVDSCFVKHLAKSALERHVWTVDDVIEARRFCALGVDSVTTNRPGWLRQQLQV